jgi:PAS domain S-box-containing protein
MNFDLFNLLVENLQDYALFATDVDGQVISWTPGVQRLLGYTEEEFIGQPIEPTFTPEDIAKGEPWKELQTAEREGRAEDVRWHVRKDGSRFWANGQVIPLRDEGGKLHGFAKIMRDDTKHKQAAEALHQSEERYRLLVEGAQNHALFLMDTQRRIVHWNSGAQRLFGYSPQEAMGQSGDMIFTPDDRAAGAPEQEAQTAITEGKALDKRWHIRKDGSLLWADGVNTSLWEDNGQLRGFVKVARDATQEKEAEEELERVHQELQQAHAALQAAHDELEGRVLERTAELRTEILQRQAAQQAREQLLQRLVNAQEEERLRLSRELHDEMGQQLTALLMGLKALPEPDEPGTRPPSSGQRLQALQDIASTLMQQMHDLAWQLRPTALDTFGLEVALRGYVQEWSTKSNIPADLVCLGLSNKSRLPQEVETALYRVVQEALTNVQRHAEAQQVSISVECRDDSVAVVIEDDGRGCDVEAAEQTQRLGLLGMRERVELVGGTLTIESTPNQGTAIYVRVPHLPGEC